MQCACAVLGLYGYLRPVWLYLLFSILAQTTWFSLKKKKVLTIKRVFLFPVQLLSETSLILRIIRLHTIRNLHRSSREVPVVLFPTDFRKIPKYQISWKFVQLEPRCSTRTGGQTGRYDRAKSRFPQFCDRAYKWSRFISFFFYHASRYIRVMKTNLMHCLSSVYFVNQPLHASGIFVAHHCIKVFCFSVGRVGM